MMVSIGKAAKELGVSVKTLRRWAESGKVPSERSPSGHRRFDLNQLRAYQPYIVKLERKTICYARVSSHDQKADLLRQVEVLEMFCSANGWTFEVIQDLGSGLNYQKRGLQKLLKAICSQEVTRLVVTHKDRLLRFGSELIFGLCENFGIEVVIINASPEEISFEEELVQDVLELVTVFSARLYGARHAAKTKNCWQV